MKKVLFIDRDGTIIKETVDEQIDAFDKMIFYPKAFTFLGKIAKELDYELVMITNQDGLGTAVFPEETFWPVHNFILNSFENEGVVFNKVFLDRTFPHENANTRKPGTGLLTEYFCEAYDLANSFVIGDRLTDMELAKNLGAKGIFINDETNLGTGEITVKRSELDAFIAIETNDWEKIYEFLKYGFCLPMDDCLAQAAIDFGGRNWLVWEADFKREKIGEMPTEMFYHFFKSFTDGAKANLNIKAEGTNEHHKIEAIFKSFAKAIKMAVKRDVEKMILPSTKGML